jgi:polysaccharide export outer membrane protein
MKRINALMSVFTAVLLAVTGVVAEAQAPAAAPAAIATTGATRDTGYKIGADDVIEADLLGQADFKTRARVKSDGTMSFPFIGTVNVQGETPVSLKRVIEGKLKAGGYYAQPIVNVEIVSFASRYVIVLGDVGTAGLQPVDRAYRVSEIIARAGGIRETGAEYVIVTRAGKEDLKLPFDKLARGSEADDPFVEAGDKIFVPKAETYYIYGQIAAPGVFPIKEEMTLRKVIARSGGLTPSGSEKRIKLFHDGKQEKRVDLERIVQGGDVIVIGERFF